METREYKTNDLQQFIEGARFDIDASLEEQLIPYEIEFLDSEIISITQYMLFTM